MDKETNTGKIYPMVITGEVIEDIPAPVQYAPTVTTVMERVRIPEPVFTSSAVIVEPKGESLGVAGFILSLAAVMVPILLPFSFILSIWGSVLAKKTGGKNFFGGLGVGVSVILFAGWLMFFAVSALNLALISS